MNIKKGLTGIVLGTMIAGSGIVTTGCLPNEAEREQRYEQREIKETKEHNEAIKVTKNKVFSQKAALTDDVMITEIREGSVYFYANKSYQGSFPVQFVITKDIKGEHGYLMPHTGAYHRGLARITYQPLKENKIDVDDFMKLFIANDKDIPVNKYWMKKVSDQRKPIYANGIIDNIKYLNGDDGK